ncbi:MAG TPA: extracellular solute-binding protein [Stellaceae bacterium]|jgi:multiple sugar transport system substrate-binding protein|nr:extracellular solute-binding protein [Stellaceae bacterium]
MTDHSIPRRRVLQTGLAATALAGLPGGRPARAADEGERIVAAAKGIGKTDLKAIMWSNYFVPMKPPIEEFQKATGIAITSIKDLSTPTIPQAAMAEALTRSPDFDIVHLGSEMIPSLVSAGYLEPLDDYMHKADYKMDAVGDYANLATYDGKTYGIITDGNIFVHQLRKDLFEDADNKKRFEDKFGKPLAYPKTWDDDFQQMKFFHNPEKGIYGSGNLRSRGFGYVWFLMYLYSFGGFPFDPDMKPTVNSDAGKKAIAVYLRDKEVAFPDSPSWGTSQMIPHIAAGDVYSCQYWGGLIKLQENPAKSKTVGKWTYGLVPGGEHGGKPLYRAAGMPVVCLMVNRNSPHKAAAAYMACWLGTEKASSQIVTDRVNSFNDAWTKKEMTDPRVLEAYTPAGVKAIQQNLQVSSPNIYLTGNQEFVDVLDKNLGQGYIGQLKSDEVLKQIDEDFAKVVKRIGTAKLKKDYQTYAAIMPKISQPV